MKGAINMEKLNVEYVQEGEYVTKDMMIATIIREYPETIDVFMEYGINCGACMRAAYESLEEAMKLHMFVLDEVLYNLNEEIRISRGGKSRSI